MGLPLGANSSFFSQSSTLCAKFWSVTERNSANGDCVFIPITGSKIIPTSAIFFRDISCSALTYK
jgi:hypothetical protein